MKKIFYLSAIVAAATMVACGGGKDDDDDKTTFVIKSDAAKQIVLSNYQGVISGYIDKDGVCRKIAEHALISGGQSEEIILSDAVDSVRLFMPMPLLLSDTMYFAVEKAHPVVKKTRNVMIIEDYTINPKGGNPKGTFISSGDVKFPH